MHVDIKVNCYKPYALTESHYPGISQGLTLKKRL